MACCCDVACFFCSLCSFIALVSLLQFCLGIFFTFIQNDILTINRLIQTDKIDSYPAYILLIFIGLGFISLILTFFAVYGISKRNRSLSLFVVALWVSCQSKFLFLKSTLYIIFISAFRYFPQQLILLCSLSYLHIIIKYFQTYVNYLLILFDDHR